MYANRMSQLSFHVKRERLAEASHESLLGWQSLADVKKSVGGRGMVEAGDREACVTAADTRTKKVSKVQVA